MTPPCRRSAVDAAHAPPREALRRGRAGDSGEADLDEGRPGGAKARAAASIVASSAASPSAAVTGRDRRLRVNLGAARPIDTAPSAPAAGFLASMKSAPPSSAADASLALATLTSSRIAATVSSESLPCCAEPLAGRAVLVTGASSGIGRAIALAAARAGADVALTYRANEAGAREVEREICSARPPRGVMQLDLADDDIDAARSAPPPRDALGRLDVWVNNAGADILTGAGASLSDRRSSTCCSPSICAARCSRRGRRRRCWPRRRGRRHHQHELGSRADRHGRARIRSCSPRSKAACWRSASRWRDRSRRACASTCSRRAGSKRRSARAWTSDRRRAVAESTPLKRWGTPEDVAGAAVFLASPAAAFMTGQTISSAAAS